jgi:release factor glutamine methyltransferase
VTERAETGRPVAYLVGSRGFLELELTVDERVLVPRPETEIVVECFLALLAGGAVPSGPVADRGTGSGNIALAVCDRRPVIATDISRDALAVASANVAACGARGRVQLVAADGLRCLRAESLAAVLANPPYVAPEDVARLPEDVRRHEPLVALVPGEGSVPAMFTRLLAESRAALRPGGWLVTEVGAGQAALVASLASVHGFGWVDIHPDLSGIERVVAARRG